MDSGLPTEQVRWFRLQRSGLVTPFATPEQAASALVGVQAQILPAAGLSLWNRSPLASEAHFDALLHDERTLVKLWGQRGTLHLYPSEEWPLVYAAHRPQKSWWERRADDPEAHRALVGRLSEMLKERGSMGRSDLRASELELTDRHLSSWGGLFYDLVRQGVACHAPRAGGEGRFVHREQWLPDLPWEPPTSDEANQQMARRYLAAYGPATVHDLAYWRGAKVASARKWVAALGEEISEVTVAGKPMLALRADLDALHAAPPPRESWPVRLLYRFDPLLLGLKEKSWIVEPAHYKRVWRPAGHIEGTILEQGRIVGTWRYDRKGSGLIVTLRPFAPLPAHVRAAAERDAAGVATFFGLALQDIRTEFIA